MYNETKVVDIQGMEMTIFESPDYISDVITTGRFWENDLMDKWKHCMPQNGLIFDIGGNIGNHSLMFYKAFPNLKIWAFEMCYNNFRLLYKNTLPYNKNIKCFNVAVSDGLKIVSYHDSVYDNNGGVAVDDLNSGKHLNVSISIDSIVIPEKVEFIKIDIEEHEIYAFKGMESLLLKDKPLIWTEDWIKFGTTKGKPSSVDYLLTLGYEIIDEDRADYLLRFKQDENPDILRYNHFDISKFIFIDDLYYKIQESYSKKYKYAIENKLIIPIYEKCKEGNSVESSIDKVCEIMELYKEYLGRDADWNGINDYFYMDIENIKSILKESEEYNKNGR